jgi:four helix bundle protein
MSETAPHKKLRPSGGYRNLRSFQTTTIIYDATVSFCERFIDKRSRLVDQMVQAARSGRQNIAEGSRASATSSQTELRLVNVARASLDELLLDYEDFLRQRGKRQWTKDDAEAKAVRLVGKKLHHPSDRSDPTNPSDERQKPMITDINSKDRLVQSTFADHLQHELGWNSVYAWNQENFGPRDGVPFSYRESNGTLRHAQARVIDFRDSGNNRFLVVRELKLTGLRTPNYNRRADLVCFVNGLPLVFIELKAVYKNIRAGFDGNLKDYLDEHVIDHAFHHNAFLVVSCSAFYYRMT